MPHELGVGREVDPARPSDVGSVGTVLADGVEDDVVGLAVPREVRCVSRSTWSAPSERTSSTFSVSHTAVTWAPKCLASCTAAVPMEPEAP